MNRGFSAEQNKWKESEGKAYFVEGPDRGYLKVSFFCPFYGSYVIFDLDRDTYQTAYVTGSTRSYLWFLSRTPSVGEDAMQRFIVKAKSLGFQTEALILVNQK